MARASRLEPDKLVEVLAPDGAQPPDVRALIGFLGTSTRRGYWRLYFTLMLDEYVEFAANDVLHGLSVDRSRGRPGGTVIWVRRAANLQHVRTVSREAQADFLGGDIAAAFLGRPAVLQSASATHGIAPWFVAACLTGGDFDTLCAACTAVPTALVLPGIGRALALGP
jgi:hypothetical protein